MNINVKPMDFRGEFLAEELGSGAFKTAHAVHGRPDLVVVYRCWESEGNAIYGTEEEFKAYSTLIAAGVPVAQIYAAVRFRIGADIRVGHLMKRYPYASKGSTLEQLGRAATPHSLQSLRTIYERLREAKLWVGDMQYLIDHDGSWVVSDPGSVHPVDPHYDNADSGSHHEVQYYLDINTFALASKERPELWGENESFYDAYSRYRNPRRKVA